MNENYCDMCSILGGTSFDEYSMKIYSRAKDRGRDYSGLAQLGSNWIANHRATPTNEDESNENQPYGKSWKYVHNGTIANDKELGNKSGIDSSILEHVLDVSSVDALAKSLEKVKGSYALAILKEDEILLACNYKPIWYIELDGNYYFSSLQHHLGVGAVKMQPYSVMSLKTKQSTSIKRTQSDRALVICSGGLDSTAVIGYALSVHQSVELLHFNYECKATNREIQAVKDISNKLGIKLTVSKLSYKGMDSSTLFSEEAITSGERGVEYALDWVPARNLLFMSYAVAYAEANDIGHIYLGTNLEESGAYPDNEEQFIRDFNDILYGAVQNGVKIEVHTPLGGLMKKEIVEFGTKYGSPLELSYSCYNGREKHCGECGPCYMRKKAFLRAGIEDPTQYENT